MGDIRKIFAVLVLAVLATAIPGSHASRNLLQTGKATQGAPTCPVDSTAVQLDFSEVKVACVAKPSAASNKTFCDACTCALFTAFTPALEAAGVFNSSNAAAVTKGVEVVAACVNTFLAQFVAAKVDVQALVELSSCAYKDNEVPACLVTRAAQRTATSTLPTTNSTLPTTNSTLPTTNSTLPTTNSTLPTTNSTLPTTNSTLPTTNSTLPTTNSTIPGFRASIPGSNTTTSQPPATTNIPPVDASSGPTADYEPDTDAPGQIINAINNMTTGANPTTGPVPTTTETPTTSPEASPTMNPIKATNPTDTNLIVTNPVTEIISASPATRADAPTATTTAPTTAPIASPNAAGMASSSLAKVLAAVAAASMLLSVLA